MKSRTVMGFSLPLPVCRLDDGAFINTFPKTLISSWNSRPSRRLPGLLNGTLFCLLFVENEGLRECLDCLGVNDSNQKFRCIVLCPGFQQFQTQTINSAQIVSSPDQCEQNKTIDVCNQVILVCSFDFSHNQP